MPTPSSPAAGSAATGTVAVGKMFEKGLRMGTGQTNVKRYKRP